MFDVAPGFTGSPPALSSGLNIPGWLSSISQTHCIAGPSFFTSLSAGIAALLPRIFGKLYAVQKATKILTKTAPDSPPSHKRRFVCKDRLYEMSFDPNDPPQVTYDVGSLLVQLDILARKAAKES
jgi:hypothetical protein